MRSTRTAKNTRFRLAKQQLCTRIKLFYSFLCRHCTTRTWKCPISRLVEDGNTRQQLSFSFAELWCSPLESASKKLANIRRIKRDGISAIKFEAAQVHFLSDVFEAVAVAVAVLVAEALQWQFLLWLVLSPRPFINGKIEEKTAGDGPSLATMFEDDRHLQGIIQNIKVCRFLHLNFASDYWIIEIWLPLPTPPCNVVSPFELFPFEKRKQTNKHPKFKWKGGGMDCFILRSYPIWGFNFVVDCS